MPPPMIVSHASANPSRTVAAGPWLLLPRSRRLVRRCCDRERCREEVSAVVGSLPRLLLLSRERDERRRNSSSAESDADAEVCCCARARRSPDEVEADEAAAAAPVSCCWETWNGSTLMKLLVAAPAAAAAAAAAAAGRRLGGGAWVAKAERERAPQKAGKEGDGDNRESEEARFSIEKKMKHHLKTTLSSSLSWQQRKH